VNRPHRVAGFALAVLALATLSACSSNPSNRQVVRDTIQSLSLPDAQEACMLDRLDGYSDDQLDAIASENENWDPAEGSSMAEASESMRLFIADFEECTGESAGAPSSEPTGSSQPTATAEPTGSSPPAAPTEPAATTIRRARKR
jgi:hypothetical protein